MVQTMFYDDDIKELPQAYMKPDVVTEELEMAKSLISNMNKPFKPKEYKDEYQERLRNLIEDKIAGKQTISGTNEKDTGNVINLMDALKASLEQTKPKTKTNKKSAAKKLKGYNEYV